jgi:uncharacterized membrane protein
MWFIIVITIYKGVNMKILEQNYNLVSESLETRTDLEIETLAKKIAELSILDATESSIIVDHREYGAIANSNNGSSDGGSCGHSSSGGGKY